MAEVIDMVFSDEYCVECSECGSQLWAIMVDNPVNPTKVTGLTCGECGAFLPSEYFKIEVGEK